MALPTTLPSPVDDIPRIFNAGPFAYDTGSNVDLYELATDSSDSLVMMRSTDGGLTFSEVDGANAPSETSVNSVAAVIDGTTIHMATVQNNATADYKYHTFSLSGTPGWGTTDEAIASGVDTDIPQTSRLAIDIAVRSNGDVVVVYNGASDTIMTP